MAPIPTLHVNGSLLTEIVILPPAVPGPTAVRALPVKNAVIDARNLHANLAVVMRGLWRVVPPVDVLLRDGIATKVSPAVRAFVLVHLINHCSPLSSCPDGARTRSTGIVGSHTARSPSPPGSAGAPRAHARTDGSIQSYAPQP